MNELIKYVITYLQYEIDEGLVENPDSEEIRGLVEDALEAYEEGAR